MKQALANGIQQFQPDETISGVKVAKIVKIIDGQPLVNFEGNSLGPITARYTRSTGLNLLQQAFSSQSEVLLVFQNNDPQKPIIIDVIHSYLDEISEVPPMELQAAESGEVTVDGKRITFNAKEQIELRCGKSSIILTKAGKIIIRGAYLLNRSSGVNRIKGGSVQIN